MFVKNMKKTLKLERNSNKILEKLTVKYEKKSELFQKALKEN